MIAAIIIPTFGACGLLFAAYYAFLTSLIRVDPKDKKYDAGDALRGARDISVSQKIFDISNAISTGARAFLSKEYQYMAVFIGLFSIILLLLLGLVHDWVAAVFSTVAFICGSLTSILAGYIGMRIAVYANSRTAIKAELGFGPGFVTAFRAGAVMGFSLVALGLIVLYFLIMLFNLHWPSAYGDHEATRLMYEALAGYGLGGSSIALFGRVGGGIYTKAADVGADLVGKYENHLNEDDPRNPAVIADNVGDNVGDIAGMGADLFGSFAEASCACMVISSQSVDLSASKDVMSFPLIIFAVGIMVSIVTSFIATNIKVVKTKNQIEPSLKTQIIVSTILMTPAAWLCCYYFLPHGEFTVSGMEGVTLIQIFVCICCGLWSGLIIGLITEYYTSSAYKPVQDLAESCRTGPATNIIYGLALGYLSNIIPVFCIAITIYITNKYAGMYGIATAAIGILSTLPIGLTIDAYGPICDNAGGIAEMAGMPDHVRERTDCLDAAGNTTAAIGKGFAIASAAFVSLALFGAFISTKGLTSVDILQPLQFAGLLVGAMLPYWFSAMTMKSVGKAALAMVKEVRRQFSEHPGILTGETPPDYERCVAISTSASLREMILPGALVMLTPLIAGFLFGPECLAGVLAGSLTSGVQLAISASNTGGAWDNAKKYIEAGALGPEHGKGSPEHEASIIGDTVGDPLKDTSGPALNILIKLMAIISLVFAPAMPGIGGGLLVQTHH